MQLRELHSFLYHLDTHIDGHVKNHAKNCTVESQVFSEYALCVLVFVAWLEVQKNDDEPNLRHGSLSIDDCWN